MGQDEGSPPGARGRLEAGGNMIGCCGAESSKFKTQQGEIDRARLDRLVAEKQKAGWSAKGIDRLRRCSCLCHNDGVRILC